MFVCLFINLIYVIFKNIIVVIVVIITIIIIIVIIISIISISIIIIIIISSSSSSSSSSDIYKISVCFALFLSSCLKSSVSLTYTQRYR